MLFSSKKADDVNLSMLLLPGEAIADNKTTTRKQNKIEPIRVKRTGRKDVKSLKNKENQ